MAFQRRRPRVETAFAAWGQDIAGKHPLQVSTARTPRIELRHLRYFLVVSEELHFRHAAERLHMTGPALSATIRQLEDELGLILLDRTTRGAALTKAGKVLAVEARRVLASVDRAIAETRRSGELGYELRVASSPWLPLERLFGFLRPLGAADMDALVRVSYMFAPEQQQRIAAAELELGIFPWIRPIPSLDHEPLYVGEYLRAFMAADHPLAAEPIFRPRDELREETLFALAEANPPLTVWLRRQAERAGYRFNGVAQGGDGGIRDTLLAIAAGIGVALLPVSVQGAGELGGTVVSRPLEPPLQLPDMVVAWSSRPRIRMKPILERVRTLAGELYAASQLEPLSQ